MNGFKGFVIFFLVWLALFASTLLIATAQTPSNELSPTCYTLGTSTIEFASDFKVRCLDPNGVTGGFFSNHEYPSGDFIADAVGDFSSTTQNLLCNAPASCAFGFGQFPAQGTTRQYRFSNSYLGSPYLTITLKYQDNDFETFFFTEFTNTPTISPIDFNTRFTDASVSGTSTSLIFTADYILQLDEFTANNRPDFIRVEVYDDGIFSNDYIDMASAFIIPLVNGTGSRQIAFDTALQDGDYLAYFSFWNVNANEPVFTRTQAVLSFEISSGNIVFQTIEELTNGQGTSTSVQYEDCGINNIFGCIKNAFIWAFIPQESIFDRWDSLWSRIENKPPFGYLTATKNALMGVNSTSTPAFSFGTIPFTDSIFDPIKLLLVIALWVIYAFFFIGRLDKLDL